MYDFYVNKQCVILRRLLVGGRNLWWALICRHKGFLADLWQLHGRLEFDRSFCVYLVDTEWTYLIVSNRIIIIGRYHDYFSIEFSLS